MQVLLHEDEQKKLTALAQLKKETYQFINHEFKIPIQILRNGTTRYQAEMCGFELESNQKEEIPDLVQRQLKRLINVGRLPDYVFVAKRAKKVIPVYSIGNDVTVTMPNGPVFRHQELAKIRAWVTDYLHEVKVLGKEGLSDKLHVRGINPTNLGLRAPIFYLKKYNVGEARFWAPVFKDEGKGTIYTHAAEGKREIKLNDGHEAIGLQQLVSELLISQDRLSIRQDLRTDRLHLPYWEKVKATLTPLNQPLIIGSNRLETYTYKKDFIVVEKRAAEKPGQEERFGLYFGESFEDLEARVRTDLKRRSLI